MAIKWKSKILLAKIEAAYGTDPAPTGAANAILATNISLSPMEGQDVSRELELPYLAAQATIPGGLHAKIGFRVELAPSGTAGTAPAWGVLLRGCGVAQTISAGVSVLYNPITDNHESIAIYFWIGGTLYKFTGARGDVTLSATAQGIAYLEFQYWGLFSVPTETARDTPTLTAFKKPQVVTKANTPTFSVDAIDMVMRSFSMALGNDVQTRFLVNSESIGIVDRAEAVTFQVEAVPLTTWDPYTKALDQSAVALELVHGTGAGKISTLAIPAMQLQRPSTLANQQNILEWPLRAVPLPTAGNDQWTLTLT